MLSGDLSQCFHVIVYYLLQLVTTQEAKISPSNLNQLYRKKENHFSFLPLKYIQKTIMINSIKRN